ncbi:MAG TPA: RNA polymerase factor sigma-54 [Mariprofundaceae bacterium]|nr:RNA polymerase factor sigma-54 [Mariprofundaceae bacterium]
MQTKLSHKLGQRLALTPQLTQSLKVLAMNAMELESYLEECLITNPMLEAEAESPADVAEPLPDRALELPDADEWVEQGDNRWENMYAVSSREGMPDREQQWHEEQSLNESLHEQIDRQPMQDVERALAHALIDSLEDDGYLRGELAELAASFGVDGRTVEHVLESIVHQLEPAGIGARDLTECLMLQLDLDNETDLLVRRLLLHFPDRLFESDEVLAGLADCSTTELGLARARMRRLDPFPGHGLRGETNIYIRPEIVFRRNNSGDIEIDIPSAGWRGIRLNERWQNHEWKGPDREFMDKAMKEAKWLMHALEQRSETLMKVAICLARRQRAFLDYGILGLKPLTLQDVADEVGLHESTISRVTNGKYADTPVGIIELKRFFSAGLPTRGGGTISVYRVQQRVKALIDSEPAGRPISDQAISERLQAEGIEIARRTVAKYREQLGLLPSSQRRRAAPARQMQERR